MNTIINIHNVLSANTYEDRIAQLYKALGINNDFLNAKVVVSTFDKSTGIIDYCVKFGSQFIGVDLLNYATIERNNRAIFIESADRLVSAMVISKEGLEYIECTLVDNLYSKCTKDLDAPYIDHITMLGRVIRDLSFTREW